MFVYEKKLQYPVRIKNTNPKLAAIIISQYGGPDGELGASLRYLSGFSNYNYWSSREYDSHYEYLVTINNGNIYADGKGNHYYAYFVLGFLALEV